MSDNVEYSQTKTLLHSSFDTSITQFSIIKKKSLYKYYIETK